MKVKELMRGGGVRVIHRERLISEVAGILDTDNISGAPLVDDDGEVVGMISKSDIVHFEFVGGDPHLARAMEVGTYRVISVPADEEVEVAARKMLDHHVHRLLVVDEHGPAGMLTSLDFVRLAAERED